MTTLIHVWVETNARWSLNKAKIYLSDPSDQTHREIIAEVRSLTETTVVVVRWVGYSSTEQVYVYGTQVTNFLTVDEPQLGIVALQGVKELIAENEQLKSRVTSLEEKLEVVLARLV